MEYEKEFIKEGLAEEDLEAASGGATQNRYDPQRCGKYTRVEYECVGFLAMSWCDHYRKESLAPVGAGLDGERYLHICVMGRYDYGGDRFGAPA